MASVIDQAQTEARKLWDKDERGKQFHYRALLWGTMKQMESAIPERFEEHGNYFLRVVRRHPVEAYAFACDELRVVLDAVIRCPPPADATSSP